MLHKSVKNSIENNWWFCGDICCLYICQFQSSSVVILYVILWKFPLDLPVWQPYHWYSSPNTSFCIESVTLVPSLFLFSFSFCMKVFMFFLSRRAHPNFLVNCMHKYICCVVTMLVNVNNCLYTEPCDLKKKPVKCQHDATVQTLR